MTTVLLTGATGSVGSETLKALAGRGLEIRVGMRDLSRGAPAGTTAVHLDWNDPSTFDGAVSGVDRLFLLTPFVEEFETPARGLLAAAAAAGVSFVLKVSASGASEDNQISGGRQHGALERALREGSIPWAVIRPNFFMSNALVYQGDAIRGTGAFYGASGGKASAYVSPADIGAVAAEILANPDPHTGRVYDLTGPEALTDAQIAEGLSAALGTPVRFVDLNLEDYSASLAAQGMPGWVVETMTAFEWIKRSDWAGGVASGVSDVLGRPAESLGSWLGRR